ncbi:carboxymuconolactone decarboxylase family protein [Phyllobacterium myrsinacearum]|uniref:Alkyl hydroperoxide reductase AhpD n=1 Tax=Phyllobacterium myrsinacearum TaxID=28101 RepID=A0A2S9JGP9_9HYPH|nr:carboxymuconolactone decarboxylase family protein [Phyllobacterium myrsinacearum]PRD52171.1 alkyl hydroperoxide reductase [Phyllobacterium myrsinacearum]PWV83784.1 alkyl hydroperoxide reductase subunit D [Phyllobacterium myrsinacearum]RZS74130.1 alkyl hydroperoxide reductase subunit D [Phyllobacterium myrsinacearum]RZV04696.1 alkyl hydroperoxide reductase subunit D [Phyllobacterium myrsinacearum]
MALEKLKSQIPEFAKDVRLNLSLFAQDEALTAAQKAGLALACAISSRNQEVQKACNAYASSILDEAGLSAARAAASIMAMNNVYYRFTHLVSDDSYSRMPAGLRMNVIANPGVPAVDFEIWCLAVSVVNGCGRCVDAHEQTLRKAGVAANVIHTAVRLAAILQSAAIALEAA